MDRKKNPAEHQSERADQKQHVPVFSQAAAMAEQQYPRADERQKRRKLAEGRKELPEAALLAGIKKA